VRYLQAMLTMGYSQASSVGHHTSEINLNETNAKLIGSWVPPVLKTIAIESQGIEELQEAIQAHRRYLQASGLWQVKEHQALREAIERSIVQKLIEDWRQNLSETLFEETLQAVVERKTSPESAAQSLLAHLQQV